MYVFIVDMYQHAKNQRWRSDSPQTSDMSRTLDGMADLRIRQVGYAQT